MTNNLIDIPKPDRSEELIEAVTKLLNNKGIILDGTEDHEEGVWAHMLGMGNKRAAFTIIPKQSGLSDQDIQSKAEEIAQEIEAKIRSGRE